MDTVEKLTTCYRKLMGSVPEGIWFAPGRVNLIGEHTDYNDGFVLPCALEQRALIAAGHRDDDLIVMHAMDLPETVELPLSGLNPGGGGWAAYLAGVLWALREAGHQVGAVNLVLTSDVPLGAGLSSSAAIECAVMAAACDLFGLEIAPMERARLAQRAENAYVGAPTGISDQAASTLCRTGHGLFLDCRTLETTDVPLPLRGQGFEILVLDTHTPHSHVDGEYGERRATCERAAAILGVRALRDVTDLDAALSKLPDARMRKRVRHVVSENDRTCAALDLARKGLLRDHGPDHRSRRGDGLGARSTWSPDDGWRLRWLHHRVVPHRAGRAHRLSHSRRLREGRPSETFMVHSGSLRGSRPFELKSEFPRSHALSRSGRVVYCCRPE